MGPAIPTGGTASAEDQTRIEPSGRRVRAFVGGTAVADSRRVLLVWEAGRLPVYFFPTADVRADALRPSARMAGRWDLALDGRSVEDAAWRSEHPSLGDHLAFRWNKVDQWFEEDDEVFVHARDPYHRVDVLNSSRQVKVSLDGVTLAETGRPRLLFETGLPTRYYLPKLDVRLDLLEPSASSTACPYKGRAVYWSVRVGNRLVPDLVWSYPAPIPECPKIEGLLSFYNEKVDIEVDGEPQPRPRTRWS